jgi:hypothetical protein
MRLEGWNESVLGSILRDAVLRTAPQDEVRGFDSIRPICTHYALAGSAGFE